MEKFKKILIIGVFFILFSCSNKGKVNTIPEVEFYDIVVNDIPFLHVTWYFTRYDDLIIKHETGAGKMTYVIHFSKIQTLSIEKRKKL